MDKMEILKRLYELYNGDIRNVRATSIIRGAYRAYAVETGYDSFYCYVNEETKDVTLTRP